MKRNGIIPIIIFAMMFLACGRIAPKLDLSEVQGEIYFRNGGTLIKWTPSNDEIDTIFVSDSLKIADISPDTKSLLVYKTIKNDSSGKPEWTSIYWLNMDTGKLTLLLEGEYSEGSLSYFAIDGKSAMIRVTKTAGEPTGTAKFPNFIADTSGILIKITESGFNYLSPHGERFISRRNNGNSHSVFIISKDLHDTTAIVENIPYEAFWDVDAQWWGDSAILVNMERNTHIDPKEPNPAVIESVTAQLDSVIVCDLDGKIIDDLSYLSMNNKYLIIDYPVPNEIVYEKSLILQHLFVRSMFKTELICGVYDSAGIKWKTALPVNAQKESFKAPLAISNDHSLILLGALNKDVDDYCYLFLNSEGETYKFAQSDNHPPGWFLRWVE